MAKLPSATPPSMGNPASQRIRRSLDGVAAIGSVCSGRHSAGEMWLAAKGYELNKRLGETIDSAKDALGITRSVPKAPPSHSSDDVQRWGEKGAFEGELDRKKD